MPNKLETEGQILNLCTNYSQNLSFTFFYIHRHTILRPILYLI
nr:hypothetical protein [Paucilactobacillus hokkaidonensis]